MKWPDDIKDLVEKYSRGYAWICINEDKKDKHADYLKVKARLEELETQLTTKGVTQEQFQKIFNSIHKILKKNFNEMSEREFDFVLQVMWGNKTEIIKRHPKTKEFLKKMCKITLEKGFLTSYDIAQETEIPLTEVREILTNLKKYDDILQYKPNMDSWAISYKKRVETENEN